MTGVRCWRDQAACRDLVTAEYDPFFADTADLQAEAIAICEICPVRDACLTFAVRTGQQYGIWGGLRWADGSGVRTARRRLQTRPKRPMGECGRQRIC